MTSSTTLDIEYGTDQSVDSLQNNLPSVGVQNPPPTASTPNSSGHPRNGVSSDHFVDEMEEPELSNSGKESSSSDEEGNPFPEKPPSSCFQTSVRFVKETDTDFSGENLRKQKHDEYFYYKQFAKGANRRIRWLRVLVLLLWMATAIIVSYGVYWFAMTAQIEDFESNFATYSDKLLENFDTSLDKRLVGINTVATAITSFAQFSNQSFPFVTIPDFALVGSNARIITDAMSVFYAPLVTEENREKWEDYALRERGHIDIALEQEDFFLEQEDIRYGYKSADESNSNRRVKEEDELELENELTAKQTAAEQSLIGGNQQNILTDGSFYHKRIFGYRENGEPSVDVVPEGRGPYFPLWHRSPVNKPAQGPLNFDVKAHNTLLGSMEYLIENPNQAVLNDISLTTKITQPLEQQFLGLSQFRHNLAEYNKEPRTQLVYPLLEGHGKDKEPRLVGILANAIYWNLYFHNVLPDTALGMVVVIENSFNQSFSYRVDGAETTYLGGGDARNPNITEAVGSPILYDKEVSRPIPGSAKSQFPTEIRSFTALSLDATYSQYTLKIYPTQDTANVYETNQPKLYALVVASIFLLATIAFLLYDYFVRRRQTMMMGTAIMNARKAAVAERDLNEYIAHEVRNPLSAALSACSFVSSEVHEEPPLFTEEAKQVVREDIRIIGSSLTYINDLLRNMLDLHRASADQIIIQNTMCNIFDDILESVSSMIYRRRNHNFDLILDCPPDICTYTDGLRLKQILLNLALNSAKFIQTGFVKLRVVVIDRMSLEESDETKEGGVSDPVTASQRTKPQKILFMVEDSGPGIPAEQYHQLFSKFEESLDLLSQGKGISLCLCKHLVELMGGEIWLDDSYDSGIEGKPGSRFIVDLDISPLQTVHPSQQANIVTVTNPRLNERNAAKANECEKQKREKAEGKMKTQTSCDSGAPDATESTISLSQSFLTDTRDTSVVEAVASTTAAATPGMSTKGASIDDAKLPAKKTTKDPSSNGVTATEHLSSSSSPPPPPASSASEESLTTPKRSTRRLSANVTEFLGPPTTISDSSKSMSKTSPNDSFQKQQEVEELLKIGAKPVQLKHARKIKTPDLKDNLNTPKAKQDDATKSKPTLPDTNTPTPKAAPAPSPSVVTKKETPDDGIPKTLSILFVDDDKMLRKLFTRSIKRILPEWSVEDVESGELALEKVASKSYDLIFMDQYMSSTTKNLLGTETVLELRRRGVSCKICGLSANDVEVEFLKVGADAFLSKPMPCNKDELRNVLKQLVCGDG